MNSPKKSKLPWIIRTYAGFGDAEATNRRFRENLKKGQKGLSIAFDLPTQNGFDADHEMAYGEVGRTGVAVSHQQDMEILLQGIDLGKINTSMTINATAPFLYALYLSVAQKQKVDWKNLRGTTQNDLLKEFVSRGTYVFHPESSLRFSANLIIFAAKNTPSWNPINCCGYHYMESGATPAQEVGFALGNACILLDHIRPQLSVEEFERVVHRISFFINSGIELVPEICKVRAYGTLWSLLCEEEYGVKETRFRAGCQVRSLTLTEQQPENNIIRIAYEALPVVLSAPYRVGALQLPGFREAQGLPDPVEQTLALRTQQILMHETQIAEYGDIFAGSQVIEPLTAKMVEESREIAKQIRQYSYEQAIDHISRELTQGLVRLKRDWESDPKDSGKTIVGVNAFMEPIGLVEGVTETGTDMNSSIERHIDRLTQWRKNRDSSTFSQARDALVEAAEKNDSIIEPSIEFAKAGGTTGEWTEALEGVLGGRYQAPLGMDIQSSVELSLTPSPKPYRILLAKCGLDGHINAIKVLAFALRQAGFEVIFLGIKQTPSEVIRAAMQESADIIGISSLSGAHIPIAEALIEELKSHKIENVPVVMGGIISPSDKDRLKKIGVTATFSPQDGQIGDVIQGIVKILERN